MASDTEAQLDLLDELLQDVDEEPQHHQGKVTVVQEVHEETPAGIEVGEEAMSTEDVLQQLDNVTLSLDSGGAVVSVDGIVDTPRQPKEQDIDQDETVLNETASAVAEDPVVPMEPTPTKEQQATEVALEEEVEAAESGNTEKRDTPVGEVEPPLTEQAEDQHEEEFADASEMPVEMPPESSGLEEPPVTLDVAGDDVGDVAEHAERAVDVVVAETRTPSVEDEDIVTLDGDTIDTQTEDGHLAEDAMNDQGHEALDDLVPSETSSTHVEDAVHMENEVVEVDDVQPTDTSIGGPPEVTELPPPDLPKEAAHTLESFTPPPAPTHVLPTAQPVFSGSLNPSRAEAGTTDEGESDQEDSDSDDDDDDDASASPPPPLPVDSVLGDEEEELEVDTAVAEEIQAALKKKVSRISATLSPTPDQVVSAPSNPLLDALESVDLVPKSIDTVDDSSKADGIQLGFDEAVEVRSAQLITSPVAHPESSAVVFGIGYQSMRKRPDHAIGAEEEAYSITKGPMFQELEREVTLVSDVSLSSRQREVDSAAEADDEEFGTIPDEGSVASPTRVDAILHKTRATFAVSNPEEAEAALVAELKRATVHEKQHLHDGDDTRAPDANNSDIDNALTLKELHSIYKRGLGDQEVRMLEDEEIATTRGTADDTTGESKSMAADTLLSKPALTADAIAEEGEDDEGEEREADSLNDEDADAVTMHSERMTFDGDHRSNPPARTDDPAGSEWKEIRLATAPSTSASTATSAHTATYSKISYTEALQYFLESDNVLMHRDRIVAEEKPPSASCFSCFLRPRLTYSGAVEQRDRLFCVAATSFDAHNTVHVSILQTIYRRLVHTSGNHRDVPLMGAHWETIGFQGSDPSTDLRGCGVLSLLQMLHVVEAHSEFARRFHSVSQHPVRHFPMACVMINITLQCLVALRSGALYKESNKRGSVFDAANALHLAIATQVMKEIQSSGDAIPLVMKRVLDSGRLNPDRMIEAHVASQRTPAPLNGAPNPHQPPSRKSSTAAAGGRASSSHAQAEFTEIGLHSVGDEA